MNWNDHLRYQDGQLFWIISRKGRNTTKPVGSLLKNGYINFGFDGKSLLAHRVVWEMFNGKIPDGIQIDHIDRNRSNNHIENLRLATNQQNRQNNSAKGFSWDNINDCFIARIYINEKIKHIGRYDTIIDARAAYLQARRKYFGEFA